MYFNELKYSGQAQCTDTPTIKQVLTRVPEMRKSSSSTLTSLHDSVEQNNNNLVSQFNTGLTNDAFRCFLVNTELALVAFSDVDEVGGLWRDTNILTLLSNL